MPELRDLADKRGASVLLFKEVEISVFETDDPKQIVLTSPIDRTRTG